MSEQSQLLKGKVCFITGAGRGIGKAIAELFAKEGAIVYANDFREGSMDSWAEECSVQNKTSVIPLYFDIMDVAAAKQAVMRMKKEQGRIDVLVNNAGIAYNEAIGMISHDHMKQMFDLNVIAAIELLQLTARVMMRQDGGSIINISSIVGVEGDKGQTAYSATKGAIIAMTKSAAKELAPKNIRVNSVAPGLTDTELFRATDTLKLEDRLKNIGLGRVADPMDIANACVFLASDRAAYISGQILGVNGCSVL